MNNQNTKNSILIIIQLLISSILALVIPAIIIRSLTFEAFSTWALLLTNGSIVSFFNLGIENGLIKITTEGIEKKDQKLISSIVYFGSFFYFIVSILAFTVLILSSYLFSNLSGIIFEKIDIQIIYAYFFIISINLVTIPFISIIKGFARYDIFSVIEIVISIANFLCVIILLYFGYEYYALLFGVILSILLRLIMGILFSLKFISIYFGKLEYSIKIITERHILYKFATSDLLTRLYSLGIPILIKSALLKVGGINFVGYYEIAARVSSISNMITPIYSTLLPEFVKNNYNKNFNKNIELIKFSNRYISIIYIPIIVFLFYFIEHIFIIWINQENEFLLYVTKFLLICSFIEILTGPSTTLLNSMGYVRVIIYKIMLEAFCYLIFVSVSVYLLSPYLIIGSELLSIIIASIFFYYKLIKFINQDHLKYHFKNIILIFTISLIIIIPLYEFYILINEINFLVVIFIFLVYILLLLSSFLRLKIISKVEYSKVTFYLLSLIRRII